MDAEVPEGAKGLVYDPDKKRAKKAGKFHKEGTEKQKAWGRSPQNLANLAKARLAIKEGRGRKPGLVNGARGITGRKFLKKAKDTARTMAEKALAHMSAQSYVENGMVNKAILGNSILMEAAEVVLARWPTDHPDETKAGQHVYGIETRLKHMQLLAPYILEKPEQKVSTRNETVEDYLIRMAEADEGVQDAEVIEHDA